MKLLKSLSTASFSLQWMGNESRLSILSLREVLIKVSDSIGAVCPLIGISAWVIYSARNILGRSVHPYDYTLRLTLAKYGNNL